MFSKRFTQIIFAGIVSLLFIAALFALVARSAPPNNYPPAKQTYEASVAQTRTVANIRPQPSAGATPIPMTPTPASIVRQPSGAGYIVADFTSPFPAMSHVITSMWYEESVSQRTIVYAGALRDDPGVTATASQGVVIVQIETLDHAPLSGGGTFATPSKDGAVRIVSANGERLTLQAVNGIMFYFDVPTHQFVTSP